MMKWLSDQDELLPMISRVKPYCCFPQTGVPIAD